MTTEQTLNTGNLDALHGILETEIRQYELAMERMLRKREMLVSGKPQLLGQIDRELMTLGQKTIQLERARQQLLESLGYPGWTLEKLIGQMPAPEAVKFNRTRDRLLRAVHDVARLNRETKDLLDLTLYWIHETVEIIANALAPEGASYDAQGGKARKQGTPAAPDPRQSTISHSV